MKLFQFIMVVLLLLILSINISAQETEDIFIAGTVSVSDPDNTGQRFVAEFKNLLAAEDDVNKLFEYIPEKENEKVNFALAGNTVYSVKFHFSGTASDDLYEVINMDGTKIEPISTVSAFFELNWQIRKIVENGKTSNSNIESTIDNINENVITNNLEEASEVLNDFINITRKYGNISEYTEKYSFFDIIASATVKKKYLKEGYSETEWDSMTLYEKSLWQLLYFSPKDSLEIWTFNDRDEYLNSVRGLGFYKSQLKRYSDGEVFAEALETVWSWQWDCFKQTGKAVNLLSGGIPDEPDFEERTEEITTQEFADTEIGEETITASAEPDKPDNALIEKNENNGVIEVIKSHMFTIFLVLAVLIASGIVMLKKKYKK